MNTRTGSVGFWLWLAVLVWGVMLGGIIYETLVVVPAWSAALPESVAVITHPRYGVSPGNMWMPFSNLHTLLAAGALMAAWKQPARRRWLLAALAIVVLSWTMQLFFFWPRNFALIAPGVTRAEMETLVAQWKAANWFRIAYIAAGFLATLRAFSLPYERQEEREAVALPIPDTA